MLAWISREALLGTLNQNLVDLFAVELWLLTLFLLLLLFLMLLFFLDDHFELSCRSEAERQAKLGSVLARSVNFTHSLERSSRH